MPWAILFANVEFVILAKGFNLLALCCLLLRVMPQLKQMTPILVHPCHGQELLTALNVCAAAV